MASRRTLLSDLQHAVCFFFELVGLPQTNSLPPDSFAWFSLGNWCKLAISAFRITLRGSTHASLFRADIIMYILTTSMEDASFGLKGIHYFVRNFLVAMAPREYKHSRTEYDYRTASCSTTMSPCCVRREAIIRSRLLKADLDVPQSAASSSPSAIVRKAVTASTSSSSSRLP